MSLQQSSSSDVHVGKILIIGFLAIVICGLALYLQLGGFGVDHPQPTPAPGEVTAAAHTRETLLVVAKTQAPSLVEATGVVTLPFGQTTNDVNIYFDGVRLWASLENQLMAIDPEAREVIVEPIVLPSYVMPGMVFDGRRLWVSDITELHPVDVASAKLDTAIEVGVSPNSMVYDGAHIWFDTFGAKDFPTRAVDPVSREVFPPVETGMTVPPELIPDMTRQVLWLIDFQGKVHSYDLRQKLLRDGSMRFDGVKMRLVSCRQIHFDGQRLWAVRRDVEERQEPESIGQSLDVDTGKVTQLPASLAEIVSSAFDGRRIWLGNKDWTVQPFDTITGQLGTAIPVYGYPDDLVFDGKRLWIALYDGPLYSTADKERHFVGLQYLVPNEN